MSEIQQLKTDTPPIKHFDFTVEFGDQKNSSFMWPLRQCVLRGKWTKNNLPGVTFEGAPSFAAMPDLPGVRLTVSSVKKVAKFWDPLENLQEDPRITAILVRAQAVLNTVFGTKYGPEPTVELLDLTDDELKSHVYWTRRILDNRGCLVISGKVPEMTEITEGMAGLIKFQSHDSSPLVNHYLPPPHRYIPVRHDPAKDQFILDPQNTFLYRKE